MAPAACADHDTSTIIERHVAWHQDRAAELLAGHRSHTNGLRLEDGPPDDEPCACLEHLRWHILFSRRCVSDPAPGWLR